jgi:hypothetical protein
MRIKHGDFFKTDSIETNVRQVLEKFFNRTYAVGIRPETQNELINITDHKSKKADGLNRVIGKSEDVTYGDLWKILDGYYEFTKKTYALGDRLKIIKSLIREFNGGKEKNTEHVVLRILTDLINSKQFGNHSEEWAKEKGFQFAMKDTGSFYKRLKVWRLDDNE